MARKQQIEIAVLGPGGVGGLLAGVLARAGQPVRLIARESTARVISEQGLRVRSRMFGDFEIQLPVLSALAEPVDVLIVATKWAGLQEALKRIEVTPGLILPLLNGLDHLPLLRERFEADRVLAGTIRVEADRPEAGLIVHSSPFLYIEIASDEPANDGAMHSLVEVLDSSGLPAGIGESEAQVMWSKLVRLNALACVTSAYDKLLGEIRASEQLYVDLSVAVAEAAAVARAEGADIDTETGLAELSLAHETLGSSMQRDIAAGREPELDAIPGAVVRAGARHGIACPTIERLMEMIRARAGQTPGGRAATAGPASG